jgi:hypothetical protein
MMSDFIELPAGAISVANRKPFLGVGTNDANYVTRKRVNGKSVTCPYYCKWKSMMTRCYSDKYPTYTGCSVCEEWLLFTNFKSWMIKQDWQGKDLDKDLLLQSNKIYSPNTCVFVPPEINRLLSDHGSSRGKYKQGVYLHKPNGKLKAQISNNGKRVHLGCFDTEVEAFEAYKKAKYAIIKEVALQQVEPLRSALLNYKIEPIKPLTVEGE